MSNDLIRRYVVRSLPIVATLALASPAAYAWDFQNDEGTFTGSWDTTLTYGQAWRIESRDCRLIAIADGGCGRSPNIDDGDLNYDTDMFCAGAQGADRDVAAIIASVGAFVRASALYDDAADDTAAHAAVRAVQGPGAEATCACSTRSSTPSSTSASMPAELRLGRQVVSWGESTFIQGGINVINHFDVVGAARAGLGAQGRLPAAGDGRSSACSSPTTCRRRLSTSLDWNDTRAGAGGLVLQHQ